MACQARSRPQCAYCCLQDALCPIGRYSAAPPAPRRRPPAARHSALGARPSRPSTRPQPHARRSLTPPRPLTRPRPRPPQPHAHPGHSPAPATHPPQPLTRPAHSVERSRGPSTASSPRSRKRSARGPTSHQGRGPTPSPAPHRPAHSVIVESCGGPSSPNSPRSRKGAPAGRLAAGGAAHTRPGCRPAPALRDRGELWGPQHHEVSAITEGSARGPTSRRRRPPTPAHSVIVESLRGPSTANSPRSRKKRPR